MNAVELKKDYKADLLSTLDGKSKVIAKETAYHCKVCDKYYASYKSYGNHTRSYHGKNKEKSKCPYCGNCFTRRDNLQQHIKLFHSSIEKQFVCKSCGEIFSSRNTCSKHKEKCFKLKEYTQRQNEHNNNDIQRKNELNNNVEHNIHMEKHHGNNKDLVCHPSNKDLLHHNSNKDLLHHNSNKDLLHRSSSNKDLLSVSNNIINKRIHPVAAYNNKKHPVILHNKIHPATVNKNDKLENTLNVVATSHGNYKYKNNGVHCDWVDPRAHENIILHENISTEKNICIRKDNLICNVPQHVFISDMVNNNFKTLKDFHATEERYLEKNTCIHKDESYREKNIFIHKGEASIRKDEPSPQCKDEPLICKDEPFIYKNESLPQRKVLQYTQRNHQNGTHDKPLQTLDTTVWYSSPKDSPAVMEADYHDHVRLGDGDHVRLVDVDHVRLVDIDRIAYSEKTKYKEFQHSNGKSSSPRNQENRNFNMRDGYEHGETYEHSESKDYHNGNGIYESNDESLYTNDEISEALDCIHCNITFLTRHDYDDHKPFCEGSDIL